MHIIDLRPEPAGRLGTAIARFDIEISPDLRLKNLKLVLPSDGSPRAYAAQALGTATATFAPALAARIAAAAYAEFKRARAEYDADAA